MAAEREFLQQGNTAAGGSMARSLADRPHAAAYLELAQRRSLPLATLDHDFIGATKALNIELLSPA